MMTLHGAGGPAMLGAARAALDGSRIRRSCWRLRC